MGRNFRLHEKDLEKLYRIKLKHGKTPKTARYEIDQLRKLIKRHGISYPGTSFKYSRDAFMDFDEDRIMNAFDCQPLNPWKQGNEHFYDHKDFSSSFNMGSGASKYEVITKYMTPDEYLDLARQATIAPGLDEGKTNDEYAAEIVGQDRIDKYAKAFTKGDKFPTPFLIFRGKSTKPSSHEGRARAMAHKKAFGPKKKLPVYIIHDPSEY